MINRLQTQNFSVFHYMYTFNPSQYLKNCTVISAENLHVNIFSRPKHRDKISENLIEEFFLYHGVPSYLKADNHRGLLRSTSCRR